MNLTRQDCVFGIIPRYAALSLLVALAWNCLIYQGAILLRQGDVMWDMTSSFEGLIPFQPGWIAVYFGCYLFWAANYILIARRGKEVWFRFFWAHLCAELICGLCFVLMPTTNIRPEIAGTDLASQLVTMLYQVDPPQNLFPSIHCMVSWLCFAGVRLTGAFPCGTGALPAVCPGGVCLHAVFETALYPRCVCRHPAGGVYLCHRLADHALPAGPAAAAPAAGKPWPV